MTKPGAKHSTQLGVLNVVGLTPALLKHAPRLTAFADGDVTPLQPVTPAVTCSVQASIVTGQGVSQHGIVGNGWYNRDEAEVRFWQRSDALVHGEKIWDAARRRDPSFTCANLFWWHNTYSTCDYVLQARPIYKADGRKIPDCYSNPPELRDTLQRPRSAGGLGTFPLFHFWGPAADIRSTQWIADAARRVHQQYNSTLNLVYLPHLDYPLQRLGPDHPDIANEVAQVDTVVSDLIDYYQSQGTRVIVLSEYGIEPTANQDAAIFINRHLREANLLQVRNELGCDMLDPGASGAFAVADHQIAHVYHKPGIHLPDIPHCQPITLDHPRAGDTVLLADPGHWFTYDHWLESKHAPDFARTVDIHRKPGYDPRELFIDPALAFPKLAIARRLLKKKLGFRQLMDVIPLDTSLVRGTHGRPDLPPEHGPVLIGSSLTRHDALPCHGLHDLLLSCLET